jgi:carbamoyl-phosphate synthase small subunit
LGTCEITSQNHGFGVDRELLNKQTEIVETHKNLNDKSVAGIRFKNKKAFSVQYHPESSPGPHDSRYLFDQFVEMMQKEKVMA